MTISALPSSTVRLLGSSATITSPLSLVKELIDNGIDAGATNVEVIISANTIDKIQVRDNGRGINFEDYDSLARRAHTSKLRTFEELRTKGGKTLGFRGEALASANSLATIKVTTKTADDPVASQLFLKFGVGGVERKQPASAPVGTTVQALKLFESLPVRRQNAQKESRKAFPKIKSLLQEYVLALPHLKLSLRVPDDPAHNWSYSPCSSSTTREAILQVFGHSLLTQCIKVTATSASDKDNSGDPSHVLIVAFLPKTSCDATLIKDKGAFISVNSRPISPLRGTGKKLTALLKTHLTRALGLTGSTRSLTRPFMQLSIECSAGSYDPNVSPMKDELLFANEQRLLDCFESLCREVYALKEALPASTEKQGCGLGDFPLDGPVLPPAASALFQEADASAEGCGSPKQSRIPKTQRSPLSNPHPKVRVVQGVQQQDVGHPSEKDLVEVMMRTTTRVNLGRTDSNTSDDVVGTGLLPVDVAPRNLALPLASKVRQRGHTDDDATPIRRFEDIGLYLKPRKEQPIEIALDETATSGETPEPESQDPGDSRTRGNPSRRPLRELRDSDLNRIVEEIDSSPSSTLSPEPDILQPHNAPRGDLYATLPRRDLSGSVEEAAGELRARDRRLLDVSPPSSPRVLQAPRQRGAHRVLGVPLRSSGDAALRTPPSSDPPRGHTRMNPPFRIPLGSNNAGSPLTSSQRNTRHQRSLVNSDSLRQTRISLNGRLNERPPQRRAHEVEGTNEIVNLRRPLGSAGGLTNRSQKNSTTNCLPQRQEG